MTKSPEQTAVERVRELIKGRPDLEKAIRDMWEPIERDIMARPLTAYKNSSDRHKARVALMIALAEDKNFGTCGRLAREAAGL